ncbi:MAG: SDR family NAD(P)-dependent oxidoreductase [Verrucomicrobiota bacterium]
MEVYIISGASKGLGQALSQQLHEGGHCVYGLSRNKGGTHGLYVECDFSDIAKTEFALNSIFQKLDFDAIESMTLINNAADLNPIVPIGKATSSEIDRALKINLAAPAILTSLFIEKTEGFPGRRRLVNITSRTAQKPYYGLSLYCMSKAGLEHLGACVVLEQAGRPNPVEVILIDPGSMDTPMQETIRAACPEYFKAVEHFRSRYENGELPSPKTVAKFVVDRIDRDQWVNGETCRFLEQTQT